MSTVPKLAWEIFKITNPLLAVVTVAIEALDKSGNTSDQKTLSAEAELQDLRARMAQAAARTAQEVAIARRIEGATVVEIEEYYEGHGEGHAGLKTEGNTLTVGASGSGRRITKRIYRFRGFGEPNNEVQTPAKPRQQNTNAEARKKGKQKA